MRKPATSKRPSKQPASPGREINSVPPTRPSTNCPPPATSWRRPCTNRLRNPAPGRGRGPMAVRARAARRRKTTWWTPNLWTSTTRNKRVLGDNTARQPGAGPGPGADGGPGTGGEKKKDDVVDAEFVDVDDKK